MLFVAAAAAPAAYRGLNLPSQHADTNQGNFLPGVFAYKSYSIDRIRAANFTALRLGINVDTARDHATLKTLRGYVDALGTAAEPGILICMWDTLRPNETGHGDGLVNDVTEMTDAWRDAAAAFAGTAVKFEIFNEPFGYNSTTAYMSEMLTIVKGAGLPHDRVVLDGLGYADDVQSLAPYWSGWLGFHLYPNWLPDGNRTQEGYSNLVQKRLRGVSKRTFVSEFGAALDKPVDYDKYQPSGSARHGDVNMLRGLDDAVSALRAAGEGVAGAYLWHGWDDSDSYSFWGVGYRGRAKVEEILTHATAHATITAPSLPREARWWMSSGKLQSNLDFIHAHPGTVTGIYTYVGLSVAANGSLLVGHNDTWIAANLAPYLALGLTVTPALGLNDDALYNGTGWQRVADVAAWVVRNNMSGVMLDYEPSTSAAPLARLYAEYVGNLSAAMHAVGSSAEMCTSDWGILDGHLLPEGYGLYAATGVDRMMSMAGTYFGTNLTKNRYNVDLEIKQGVSLSQLAVGVGTMIDPNCVTGPAKWDYNWTESKLRDFVGFVESRSISKLYFWRADIDDEGECTAPYYFDVARRWLAGGTHS